VSDPGDANPAGEVQANQPRLPRPGRDSRRRLREPRGRRHSAGAKGGGEVVPAEQSARLGKRRLSFKKLWRLSMNLPGHRIVAWLGKASLKTHVLQMLHDRQASPNLTKHLEAAAVTCRSTPEPAIHASNDPCAR